jgi:hypothetical protein
MCVSHSDLPKAGWTLSVVLKNEVEGGKSLVDIHFAES